MSDARSGHANHGIHPRAAAVVALIEAPSPMQPQSTLMSTLSGGTSLRVLRRSAPLDFVTSRDVLSRGWTPWSAGLTQLVECQLPKLDVASSNLVSRSNLSAVSTAG